MLHIMHAPGLETQLGSTKYRDLPYLSWPAYLQLTVLQVVQRQAAALDVLVDVHDTPCLVHDIVQSPILAQLHQDGQSDSLQTNVTSPQL